MQLFMFSDFTAYIIALHFIYFSFLISSYCEQKREAVHVFLCYWDERDQNKLRSGAEALGMMHF